MHCTVDQQGRVAIPKPIRDVLRLEPGSVLEVVAEAGKFVLTPVGKVGLTRKKGVLIYAGEATGDLTRAVEDERHKRDQLASWPEE